MRKKSWIILGLMALVLTATFLFAGTPAPDTQANDTACCKMKMQECLKKQKANNPGEMIMESLSHQFLSISPF